MQHHGTPSKEGLQFRLVVSMSRESGWRAAVLGPDAAEHVFFSPFELARYLAWPAARMPHAMPGGIH